ncbi:hypothetical protein BS78_08G066800 [Paspalum vaginatum]|nr:hypothetical protein BS78_08G066800 [Paspalum vaginatum]
MRGHVCKPIAADGCCLPMAESRSRPTTADELHRKSRLVCLLSTSSRREKATLRPRSRVGRGASCYGDLQPQREPATARGVCWPPPTCPGNSRCAMPPRKRGGVAVGAGCAAGRSVSPGILEWLQPAGSEMRCGEKRRRHARSGWESAGARCARERGRGEDTCAGLGIGLNGLDWTDEGNVWIGLDEDVKFVGI